jgi:hypothetical protein
MHLCFIDESGSPPKPSAKKPRPYFIIAGVIMHEAQWEGISEELKALRRKPEFSFFGEIKWRFFGADNKDPENSVSHLDATKRDEFRRQFFEIITKRKSVKIIACISSVQAAYRQRYIKDEEDLYVYSYKVVSERFQYYMQDISRVVGDKQLGIMIADHRGKKQDDVLRSQHHGLVEREGMFSSKYGNYVETIFLTPSHLSVGIQFADMVAGAIGRAFNVNDRTWFDVVKPSFRSSPTGKFDGYGLVKFPKGSWV